MSILRPHLQRRKTNLDFGAPSTKKEKNLIVRPHLAKEKKICCAPICKEGTQNIYFSAIRQYFFKQFLILRRYNR